MIERNFVGQKMKESQIKEYMAKTLGRAGYSHTEIQRTPVGEKIVIYTTRPGLIVGKKGENIKRLTAVLKNRFRLENPQIEIGEVQNPMIDPNFVAGRIASSMERFGSKRFKSIGYKMLQSIMDAGAVGAEIVLSGKLPSQRARRWRFFAGRMKKSGDISMSQIPKAQTSIPLKAGTVGVKVSIMTPDIKLVERELDKVLSESLQLEELKAEQQVASAQERVQEQTPQEQQPAAEEKQKEVHAEKKSKATKKKETTEEAAGKKQ